jgi:hypothetical protein
LPSEPARRDDAPLAFLERALPDPFMSRRIVVTALACAAIVFACAPRAQRSSKDAPSGNDSTKRAATRYTSRQADEPMKGAGLGAALTQSGDTSAPSFVFEVTNYGEQTEVRFPTGKTHEFVVLDDREREVWRSSTGRLFTQSLQTKQLRTGNALRYVATWNDAKPGTYRVVAVLNSSTHPQRVESGLIVP